MIHAIYSNGYVALLMPRKSNATGISRNSDQSKIIVYKKLKEQQKQKVKSKISKKKRFQRKKNLIEILQLTIYLISKNISSYHSKNLYFQNEINTRYYFECSSSKVYTN